MASVQAYHELLKQLDPILYTDKYLNGLSKNDLFFALRSLNSEDTMTFRTDQGPKAIAVIDVDGEAGPREVYTADSGFGAGGDYIGTKVGVSSVPSTGVANVNAINAVLAAGGSVWIDEQSAPIEISGRIIVTDKVNIKGPGSAQTASPIVFKCMTAGSGIDFGSGVATSGGESGGFKIDGNGIATNPMYVGLTVGREFSNIDIVNAAGTSLILDGAQNCLFKEVNIQGSTQDLVKLDRGAGGNVFLKCEFGGAGRYHHNYAGTLPVLPFTVQYPIYNIFMSCILEYTTITGGPIINHAAGQDNRYSFCTIVATDDLAAPAVPALIRTSLGFASCPSKLQIDNCVITSNVARAGLHGVDVENGTELLLSGITQFAGMGNAVKLDTNGIVEVSGIIKRVSVATLTSAPGSNANFLMQTPLQTRQVITRAAGETALTVQVAGNDYASFDVTAEGGFIFRGNSGGGGDVTLVRVLADLLSLGSNDAFRIGSTSTAGRPSAVTVGPATILYDSDLGAFIYSNGAAWTAFGGGGAPAAHAASHGFGQSDALTLTQAQITNLTTDLGAKAPLASPTLTGTPTVPTAAPGTNTNQAASTAFVLAADGLLVPKSLVDAKGDLLVGTANDTVARLPVGVTNGHVLTVDSAEATGLKYAAPAGGSGLTHSQVLARSLGS